MLVANETLEVSRKLLRNNRPEYAEILFTLYQQALENCERVFPRGILPAIYKSCLTGEISYSAGSEKFARYGDLKERLFRVQMEPILQAYKNMN